MTLRDVLQRLEALLRDDPDVWRRAVDALVLDIERHLLKSEGRI